MFSSKYRRVRSVPRDVLALQRGRIFRPERGKGANVEVLIQLGTTTGGHDSPQEIWLIVALDGPFELC